MRALFLRIFLFTYFIVGLFGCQEGFSTDPDLDANINAGVPDGPIGEIGVFYPDGSIPEVPSLLLRGVVVTPAQVIPKGEVLTQGDRLTCVAESCEAELGASGAIKIDTGGIIFPGLIDSHNHTDYNYLPVWANPIKYGNHSQWQGSAAYKGAISGPHTEMKDPKGKDGKGGCDSDTDCSTGMCVQGKCENVLCEMIKYGEIRALIGGATVIQGTTLRKCADTLIRNVDLPYHGLGSGDTVRTSVLGVYSITNPEKLVSDLKSGSATAFIIHLGEGTDETARKEFDELEALGLLLPQVTIIHGTALGDKELAKVKATGMNLIWSPSSNLALYGETNNISAVWNMGIPFALSPDWTPSGEADILGELRRVWEFNKQQLGGLWSARDLVEMVTVKAAQAVKFENEIGELAVGKRADLLVIRGNTNAPYEALVTAKQAQVRLVILGGKVLYGDSVLMTSLVPNEYCESIDICGTAKILCVKEGEDTENKFNQTLTDIESALNFSYKPGILSLCTEN
ncbi:MAG: amidohydrolase family protein [Pseudomonadota bacterium]